MSKFKGYSLFNDVEDKTLQANNRANVMANIFEDHRVDEYTEGTSPNGAALIFGYMGCLPEEDRLATLKALEDVMKKRGYIHAEEAHSHS